MDTEVRKINNGMVLCLNPLAISITHYINGKIYMTIIHQKEMEAWVTTDMESWEKLPLDRRGYNERDENIS